MTTPLSKPIHFFGDAARKKMRPFFAFSQVSSLACRRVFYIEAIRTQRGAHYKPKGKSYKRSGSLSVDSNDHTWLAVSSLINNRKEGSKETDDGSLSPSAASFLAMDNDDADEPPVGVYNCRVVCLSDTHNLHGRYKAEEDNNSSDDGRERASVERPQSFNRHATSSSSNDSDDGSCDSYLIPPCDVLVHCGDFTENGTASECASFARWLRRVMHSKVEVEIKVPLTAHEKDAEKTRENSTAAAAPKNGGRVRRTVRLPVPRVGRAVVIAGNHDTAMFEGQPNAGQNPSPSPSSSTSPCSFVDSLTASVDMDSFLGNNNSVSFHASSYSPTRHVDRKKLFAAIPRTSYLCNEGIDIAFDFIATMAQNDRKENGLVNDCCGHKTNKSETPTTKRAYLSVFGSPFTCEAPTGTTALFSQPTPQKPFAYSPTELTASFDAMTEAFRATYGKSPSSSSSKRTTKHDTISRWNNRNRCDILLTHGPPLGRVDGSSGGDSKTKIGKNNDREGKMGKWRYGGHGSPLLRRWFEREFASNALSDQKSAAPSTPSDTTATRDLQPATPPRLHVCGHLHSARGVWREGAHSNLRAFGIDALDEKETRGNETRPQTKANASGFSTMHVNASSLSPDCKKAKPPIVIDVPILVFDN